METLSQAALGRAIGLSAMQVGRLLKALYRRSPMNREDALKLLVVTELCEAGFSTGASVELLNEQTDEFRYCAASPSNRAWVLFIEMPERSFRLAALSPAHLIALTDTLPVHLTMVLPLHRIVAEAESRLQEIEAREGRKAAA